MNSLLSKLLLVVVWVALVPPASATDLNGGPVVVELFTSEGCSSCPPADALLGKLDQERNAQPQVIVLGEHVDYWNDLGWKDRFSSADFSRRQNQYARQFKLNSVYTPQMVIDGRYQLVGNNEGSVREKISAAAHKPKATAITLSWNQGKLTVNARGPVRGSEGIFLAITENGLSTSVARGENSGRTLRHSGVVRTLHKIGKISGGHFSSTVPVELQPGWKPENLRVVVFAQSEGTGEVLGAASLDARPTAGPTLPGQILGQK